MAGIGHRLDHSNRHDMLTIPTIASSFGAFIRAAIIYRERTLLRSKGEFDGGRR